MEQAMLNGIDAILSKETWTCDDQQLLVKELFACSDAPSKLKSIVSDLEAKNPEPKGGVAMKIGMGKYLLCQFKEALSSLANATDNKDRRYMQALCYKQLRLYDKAAEELDRAKDRGFDGLDVELQRIEVQALSGRAEDAEKSLAKYGEKLASNADYCYVAGLINELRGLRKQAVELYSKARAINSNHTAATFRLAYFYDLHGEEEQALQLYRECISRPPVYANALMNMSVLYEDLGQTEMAIACLRRVLMANNSHARARLYMKDVEAARTMFYDEDQAKRIARRNAVLDIPVTDFELSVRARNCLKKMNIRTLGDLVRTTEPELLSYKNFGETSLKEIKDMLSAKGLRLGQAIEEASDFTELVAPKAPAAVAATSDGVGATPLEQVEFSIRARRALQSLNIHTLGELAARSEGELLSCRNFGQTSLNEVRQRLAEHGMQLRETN